MAVLGGVKCILYMNYYSQKAESGVHFQIPPFFLYAFYS